MFFTWMPVLKSYEEELRFEKGHSMPIKIKIVKKDGRLHDATEKEAYEFLIDFLKSGHRNSP